MARYLDQKNDLPFKRIFGEHPDLLEEFSQCADAPEKGSADKRTCGSSCRTDIFKNRKS
jgi:hypothetical protein